MSLLTVLGAGVALGLSLAAPPGPVNALMARETTRRGFAAGARIGLGATSADACFLLATLAGASVLLARGAWLLPYFALAGAALLGFFAYGAWRDARGRTESAREGEGGRARVGFATGFLIAATSPWNYAWWLGAGVPLFSTLGWLAGVGLVLGVLAWLVTFNALLALGARRFERLPIIVSYVSAGVLALFAAFLVVEAARGFGFV
ncbi:MAG: LysE family translocator [Thermoplasmatota archaeon]